MKDDVEPKLPAGRLFLTVFPSIMLPMFLAVVDQTIVSTALPAIAASLGSVERVSWVVVSYLVAGTIAAPVYGQLRDVYGGKPMMFVALGIFLAASLLCTVSTSIEMLSLRARPAGPRRRRPDDAVAGADRRDHPAARARALSGLPRLRHGDGQHLRAGHRRLSHAPLRLAQRVPGQPAARRRRLPARRAPSAPPRTRAALVVRRHRPRAVRGLHRAGTAGPGAGAALECGEPRRVRPADGDRLCRARCPGAAGAACPLPAAADLASAPAHHLAQRCASRLPRRHAGVAHRLPADLPARRARHLGVRDRAAAAAVDDRHRLRLHGSPGAASAAPGSPPSSRPSA